VSALSTGLGAGAALAVLGAARTRPAARAARAMPPAVRVPWAIPPAHVAAAGVGALALGLLAPPLGLVPIVLPPLLRHRRARRQTRVQARALASALPEAIDLLLLCTGAGLSLPLAHPLVAARAPAPVGPALAHADRAVTGGTARADALLAALVPHGDRAASLAHVLVDHLRYGVALGPGLERLGLELRLERRRRVEEEIRRVPLRLLAPLLCCVLPAFGLLTVVPLLVASLRSLPT
jgi:Flp pilus assembly protein TadB